MEKASSPILVSIVIVNFNAGDLIVACIDSVIEETSLANYEIIVVDNNSMDESIADIRHNFPQVKVIESEINLGFAAGNNVGFAAAIGEYILVLNPDTVITNRAIDKSIAYLAERSEVGVVGCKVFWETGDVQSTMIRFPTLADVFANIFIPNKVMRKIPYLNNSRYGSYDVDSSHDVDVVAGCYMLLPRKVVDDLGGMDEDFFMFGEEVEWCWRIKKGGKRIHYFSGSQIIHVGGGCSSTLSYKKELLIAKGSLLVFKKTRGSCVAIMANLLMILRDTPRAIIFLLIKLFSPKRAEKLASLKVSLIRCIYLFRSLIGREKKIRL